MRSTAALCHHSHMTSHNSSHSVPTLRLAVAPHAESLPGDRLLANVSAEALLRAASFLSPKRRLEFLWSRVLLAKLLENEPQAAVVEIPPRSPRIEGADVSETSISHTKTWIGAIVSSVPVGIDMEVMQPSRVNEIQDDNCVTVSNCGQSVCDNKYGTPLHQIVHTFLYDTLGTGINT